MTNVLDEFRQWLETNWDETIPLHEWWQRLADSGWAVPHWPVEWFGRGATSQQRREIAAILRSFNIPGPPAGLGTMLAGPTILNHGTPEQKARLLRPIISGSESWCQLFSEPSAGSDLAALQTRAVREGPAWRVTGQKIWTSNGQVADRGMLLARTQPGSRGRDGITWFVIDMHQPEIEVRPLREMTGRTLFTQVFMDGALVHSVDAIGPVNGGWDVARTTLACERSGLADGAVGVLPGPRGGWLERPAGELMDYLRRPRSPSGTSLAMRGRCFEALAAAARFNNRAGESDVQQKLAAVYILERIAAAGNMEPEVDGDRLAPVRHASVGKLLHSMLVRQARDAIVDILGPDAMATEFTEAPLTNLQELLLFSPAVSIYGGTDEIQRNILGERVLGLPKGESPH
jgi:alkylation response protein AidB-like acyl-CoA dehydrogenase